jgi:hypothetical protein
MRVLVLVVCLIWSHIAAALPHGGGGVYTPVSTNAAYPLPIQNYATNGGCATNYYVNGATGSDSYNGTSQTFTSGTTGPWATITHAESTLAGTHAATCINVASGTYPGSFQAQCVGNTNSYTGYCTLRCAPNATTATARPALYATSGGTSGSLPNCTITNSGHNDIELGGVIQTSNGSSPYNYFIIDGLTVTDVTTLSSSITSASYNSSTGVVSATIGGIAVTNFTYNNSNGLATWTLASTPLNIVVATTGFCVTGMTGTGPISTFNGCFGAQTANSTTITSQYGSGGLGAITYSSGGTLIPPISPSMCMTVAGVTGTGAANVNGYQCATTGTTGTTVNLQLATGLTISGLSGGTIATPDSHGSGSEVGSVGIGQGNTGGLPVGCHHCVFINNYVYGMGGAGIQVQSSDYFVIANNWTQNNAWTNPFAESGIDITYETNTTEPTFTAGPLDVSLGSFGPSGVHSVPIHSLIVGNVSSNNGNPVGGTDGNGIIIDTNNQAGSCGQPPSTNFGTLVYQNVIYLNAGRGINMYNSSNEAIFNNTLWNNAQTGWNNNPPQGSGPFISCGSYNWIKDNIAFTTPQASGLNTQSQYSYSAQSTVGSLTSPGLNVGILWTNNILYENGTPTPCQGASTIGGYACVNGYDQVFTSTTKPSAWASGTTYSVSGNTFAGVTGSDSNTYGSITSSANLGHNPVTDAPTVGTQGSWWQNNGPPNNVDSNPNFTAAGLIAPNWVLQAGSPGLGTSGSDVNALGGTYTVATPNMGAF